MLSSASAFMAAASALEHGRLQFGILGSVSAIPAGFTLATIACERRGGVNGLARAWGQLLRAAYGKRTSAEGEDVASTYLGYNTDHGAYYYYKPIEGRDYGDTLRAVYQYASSIGVPYRWALLDSWWYYKGFGDGVKEWTARPDAFKDGNAGCLSLKG